MQRAKALSLHLGEQRHVVWFVNTEWKRGVCKTASLSFYILSVQMLQMEHLFATYDLFYTWRIQAKQSLIYSYSAWQKTDVNIGGGSKAKQKPQRWKENILLLLLFWVWLSNLKVPLWFHLLHSLFASPTPAWHVMKANMKRANRRRWVDVVLRSQSVCFGLLCACVCVCALLFETVHVCMRLEANLALIAVFSVQHHLPRYCCLDVSPRRILCRLQKVGLHLPN